MNCEARTREQVQTVRALQDKLIMLCISKVRWILRCGDVDTCIGDLQ